MLHGGPPQGQYATPSIPMSAGEWICPVSWPTAIHLALRPALSSRAIRTPVDAANACFVFSLPSGTTADQRPAHLAAKPSIVRAALEFTIHRAVLLPKSQEDLEMGFWTHAKSVNSSADPRTVHRSPSDRAAPPSRRDQPGISHPDLRCAVGS
jgi:hypothetical protein